MSPHQIVGRVPTIPLKRSCSRNDFSSSQTDNLARNRRFAYKSNMRVGRKHTSPKALQLNARKSSEQ